MPCLAHSPSPIPYSPFSIALYQFTLISFLFGEFLLALQQNAKVESDWCETHPPGLLSSRTPKTPEKI
jgi:hypothetical protein